MTDEVRHTAHLRLDDRGRPWHIHLGWAVVDGRFECVDVRIHSTPIDAGKLEQVNPLPPGAEPGAVTSTGLRSLTIGSLIDAERTAQVDHLEAAFGGRWRAASQDAVAAIADEIEQWRRGHGRLSSELLAGVAYQYSAALAAGQDPTKRVAELNHISHSTAAKWVARARAIGELPPTRRGVKKGRPT